MKSTRLSFCFLIFAALTFWRGSETQAAITFTLPHPPNNQADGFVRETLGVPFQLGLGIAPEYSLFTVDIHPGDSSPGGAGAPIPIPPIPGIRYAGWCFDTGADINPGGPDYFPIPGTWYGGALYSSLDPDLNDFLPGPPHINVQQGPETWNKINWIINHRHLPLPCAGNVVPTMFEVQRAIWVLFNQAISPAYDVITYRPLVVQCIIDAATAATDPTGANPWVPSCGDKIAIIFNIDINWDLFQGEIQLVFLEVPTPRPTVNLPDSSACQGTPATLTATATGTDGNWHWKGPDGQPILINSATIPVTVEGTYTVTVSNIFGCSASDTGTFSYKAQPEISVNSAEICVGESVTLNAIFGGGTIQWSTGAITPSITVTPGLGTHTFTVTNTGFGGCLVTATGTVKVNAKPDVTVNSAAICPSGSATLTATVNPPGSYTYLWSPGGATTQSITVSPASTTEYTVTVTGPGECSAEAKGTVTIRTDCIARIGDRVWYDINGNGVQDGGETGVPNVTVELYKCVGDVLVGSMLTDGSGFYLFVTAPGDYYVKFSNLPAGFVFTSQDQGGDDATDSDADTISGKTICTTLTIGETDLTWDAGIINAPCVSLFDDYLIIGMRPRSNGEAVTIGSSQEIGANRQTLSGDNPSSEPKVSPVTPNISPAYPAPFSPDLRDVFFKDPSVPLNPSKNRWLWDVAGQFHYLPSAAPLFRGVDWSGEVAVTSPSGSFSLQDINVFATVGFRSRSTTAPVNVSNSRFFAAPSLTGVLMDPIEGGGVSQPARGWIGGYDHDPLLAELRILRTFIRSLPKDADFHSGNSSYPRDLVNRNTIDAGGSLTGSNTKLVYDLEALDPNGDGFAVIDIPADGTDFEVNNSDWIITDSNLANGTPFAIFRLRGGANMNMSQSSIMAGQGLGPTFGGLAAIFVKVYPEEEFFSTSGSSDTVFNANNLVINRIGFWDLNTIGDANTDTDYAGYVNRSTQNNYTKLGVNNGQGCGQFISGHVYFQNVRFVRCTECIDTTLAAVSATVPSPYATQDIGTPALVGAAGYANGKFTINGSGSIGSSSDSFRFVYQLAGGDCSVEAKVVGMQNTDPWAKAGVMIRENLSPNSKHASVFLTPGNGVAFQSRATTGGTTTTANTAGLSAPYWLKVTRTGNTFTAERSLNGMTWTVIGTRTVTMGASVYIGLGVASQKDSVTCTATIDQVIASP